MFSRRTFLQAAAVLGSSQAIGGVAIGATMNPTSIAGVQVGVCAGSYRDIVRGADEMAYVRAVAQACAQSGAGLVEYHASHFEPVVERVARLPNSPTPAQVEQARVQAQAAREALREWRLKTPISFFADVRREYEAAGVTPFSYAHNFQNDMTEAELENAFLASKALGCKVISTNGTKVDMGPRLAPFAVRHDIDLGFHNHAGSDMPNEVGSVASFEKLFTVSPRCKANLDIGHFVAGNEDPVAFIKKYHDRITHLHFKDRRKNKGANLPWGEGDTPLKEVLLLVRDNRYPIPCLVEYEYYNAPGTGGSIEEDRRCLEFMRSVLTS